MHPTTRNDTQDYDAGWPPIWQGILDLALVLWIVRVPVTSTALGLLVLGAAPQAQDLFVEFARSPDAAWSWLFFILRIVWFLAVLMLFWSMPTHYAARLLLDTDVRFQSDLTHRRSGQVCLRAFAVWVPRVLGLLTFVAVLLAIWRSGSNLPNLDEKDVIENIRWSLVEMAVLVALTAAGFLWYVIKRPRNADVPLIRNLKPLSRRLAPIWQTVSPPTAEQPPDDDESRGVGRIILIGLFVFFAGALLLGPELAGKIFPRAMAVPFVLGGWLPFLSFLGSLGRRFRAPLIAGAAISIALVTLLLGDNHSIRRIPESDSSGPMPLETAVKLWMHENGCDGTPAACPRPLIVTASGGASRAAFFMSSIVGYLMQESSRAGLDQNQMRNRLFAISGISGGSVGAVMVAAALSAKRDSTDHPCAESPVDLWWGKSVGNWRDCFESLTSGDFLTANFFGLTFNDMFPFGPWRDRAAVLEDAWTKRFSEIVTRGDKPVPPRKCAGLECPFWSLRPILGHWIPILVLNGTSEATGGRIITTLLGETYRPDASISCPTTVEATDCPIFVEAAFFHRLLASAAPTERSWPGFLQRFIASFHDGRDVRLSTAAHNSARFPIISPPGTLRNSTEDIIDRILDGGYFENYGALGGKELALAIHAVNPALMPLVIVASNDPDDLLSADDDSEFVLNASKVAQGGAILPTQVENARATIDGSEPVTELVSPITTVANARTAHGILGVDELRARLHEAIPQCRTLLIKVRVWPQYENGSKKSKAVSMSWWLSKPIQRHLHQQTEAGKNKNFNAPHLDAMWQLIKSGCT